MPDKNQTDQGQLNHLKNQLGNIEQTMCDRWVSTVRELWGARNLEEEAAFCPEVKMQPEIILSTLAGEVEIIRASPPSATNNVFMPTVAAGYPHSIKIM